MLQKDYRDSRLTPKQKDTSNPHHVLLVADPQLVDPHTYPDRPWPLSSLTILYTDLYMKRAYRTLLTRLQPDSTLFLGDLFDGGREWSARRYKSPEERYQQYGQDFWLQEYKRFQEIFVDTWYAAGLPNLPNDGGRRLITSLPGNHDLGFAGGINIYVKSRFEAHFGPTNRIDILGNHTFVSLDTLSLSAMDQVDPKTGASGAGDGSAAATESSKIWKPVEEYLSEAKGLRERLVRQELRNLYATNSNSIGHESLAKGRPKFQQTVQDIQDDMSAPTSAGSFEVSSSQFPTIVLSHVPLYRSDADSGFCGPLREHGSHIPLSQGYQYQNVLTPLISKDIVDHLDANQVTQIYSGDDHDYCEIEHDEFTGRIREITVKSVSWAMGVRKPGVQLASLWNPIDIDTAIINNTTDESTGKLRNMPKHTVQNRLCLLPDQLGIFIRYGELLGLTLIILLVRAIRWRPSTAPIKSDLENPVYLAISYANGEPKRSSSPPLHSQAYHITHDSSSSTLSNNSVTSRRGGPQSQGSISGGYGNIPLSSRSRTPSPSKRLYGAEADSDDWGNPTTTSDRIAYAHRHHDPNFVSSSSAVVNIIARFWLVRRSRTKLGEFMRSVLFVGIPVLALYFWLLWRDM